MGLWILRASRKAATDIRMVAGSTTTPSIHKLPEVRKRRPSGEYRKRYVCHHFGFLLLIICVSGLFWGVNLFQ
jgi:hypothetical protein